jgi:hypothetical protein
MLQINPKQYKELSKAELDKFINNMVGEILRLYPEKVWKLRKDELRRLIEKLIAQGNLYGLTTAYNLSRFIICSFELGLEFELKGDYKNCLDILLNKKKEQEEKLDEIDELVFGLKTDTE